MAKRRTITTTILDTLLLMLIVLSDRRLTWRGKDDRRVVLLRCVQKAKQRGFSPFIICIMLTSGLFLQWVFNHLKPPICQMYNVYVKHISACNYWFFGPSGGTVVDLPNLLENRYQFINPVGIPNYRNTLFSSVSGDMIDIIPIFTSRSALVLGSTNSWGKYMADELLNAPLCSPPSP